VPFCPFTALFAPVILFVDFKWFTFVFLKLCKRPQTNLSSQDIGVFIMRLFALSCVLFGVLTYFFLSLEFPHEEGCGPFDTRTRAIAVMENAFKTGFPLLWTILTSVILYTALAAVLILLLVFQLNKINAYRTYLLDQHLFSSRQIEVLQKEVTKLSKQLSVLKKRFARAREEMQSEGSEGETSFAPTPSVHSRASSVAVPRKSVRIDADRAAQSDNRAEP